MPYRKGELSPADIDRGWPHQVALPASLSQGDGDKVIDAFCRDLSRSPRGHSVFHEGQWWNVFCFAQAPDAEKFRLHFGGEPFNPKDRGRGSTWARWDKSPRPGPISRKTAWQVPHEWLDHWWEPSELMVAVDAERKRFARFEEMYRPELKPLLEAWAAGTFAMIRSQDRPVQIRLERDRFPDFVLRVREEVLSFELTEADREGRRRDEEYRQAAERLEHGLPLLPEGYDPDEEEDETLRAIAHAIERKARKHYPSATNLLVYVNLSELGDKLTNLSAFQFADQWGGHFASCWLLWQEWIIRLWPNPCRIRDQRRA